MGKKSKKSCQKISQRNFIKQGGGGQRPFINFIKKQEKWYGVGSLNGDGALSWGHALLAKNALLSLNGIILRVVEEAASLPA